MVKYAYPILPWGVVLIQLSYAIAQSGNDGDLSPYSTVNISNSNNNNHPLYGGYDNTMSIIAGVLISVLFVMGIIALFLRQCRSDQAIRLGTGTRRGVTERSRIMRTTRGIDQATIEKFPIFLYSDVKEHKIGKVSLECAVCLNEFEDDNILRLLPQCDHVFHPLCIDAWLVSHITCPVCRANLKSLLGEIPTVGGGATGGSAGGGGTELSVYEVNEGENQLSIQVMHSPLLNNIRNPSEIQSQSPITRSSPLFPRFIRKFPRSHSTGHSLVLPGENVERFTLKLPEEVRRILNRTRSFIALPNGDGSDSGENTGKGGGGGGGESSRGRNHRFVKLPREGKLDQAKVPTGMSFFTRNSPARSWKSEGNESTSTPLPI